MFFREGKKEGRKERKKEGKKEWPILSVFS